MSRVALKIPDPWLDCMDKPWSLGSSDGVEVLDFRHVVIHSLRRMPVQSGEDAERTLDILHVFKDGAVSNVVVLDKTDYAWLTKHLREHAHRLWNAPDSALLVRYVSDGVNATEITE